MLRLSLRRWCAAAPSSMAAAAAAASSPGSAPPPAPPATTLPDFYGKSFTISPRTWAQIARKNAEEGFTNDARYLRLAVDSGGCHGYLYKFAFELNSDFNRDEDIAIAESDAVAPSDAAFTAAQPSPRVVVDSMSASKLENATLDFHSELKGSAFVVVGNELVDQSCACAMSFSLKKKKPRTTAGAAGSAKGSDSAAAAAPAAAAGLSRAAEAAAGSSSASNARPITRRSAARATS